MAELPNLGDLRCEHCGEPVAYSLENDYVCPKHSFVNAVRQSDGAVLKGDGCGSSERPTILRYGGLVYGDGYRVVIRNPEPPKQTPLKLPKRWYE